MSTATYCLFQSQDCRRSHFQMNNLTNNFDMFIGIFEIIHCHCRLDNLFISKQNPTTSMTAKHILDPDHTKQAARSDFFIKSMSLSAFNSWSCFLEFNIVSKVNPMFRNVHTVNFLEWTVLSVDTKDVFRIFFPS